MIRTDRGLEDMWSTSRGACSKWTLDKLALHMDLCGNIVDVNLEVKVVRLKSLHMIVNQAWHYARHSDQAHHQAFDTGPFLALVDLTV
jgi:hypothetical protein